MKFECDSCGANYMIADEKVGKRGVKVKCKRCSHVIIVKPAKEEAAADLPPDEEPSVELSSQSAADPGDSDVFSGADAGASTGPASPAPGGSPFEDETMVGGAPSFSQASPSEAGAFAGGGAGFADPPEDDDGGDAWASGSGEPSGADDVDLGDDVGGGDLPDPAGAFAGGTDLPPPDNSSEGLPVPPDMDLGASGDDFGDATAASPAPASVSGLGSEDKTAIGAVPGWEMSGAQGDTEVGALAGGSDPHPGTGASDEGGDDEPADEGRVAAEAQVESSALDALAGLAARDAASDDNSSGASDEGEGAFATHSDEADRSEDKGAWASDEGAGAEDDLPVPPPMDDDVPAPPAEVEGSEDSLDMQLGGAFDSMFGGAAGGLPPAPGFEDDMGDMRGPTQVLNLDQMEALRAQATPSMMGESVRGREPTLDGLHPGLDATLESLDSGERTAQGEQDPWSVESAPNVGAAIKDDVGGWHVAIDDEDVGPLKLSEILTHIQSGRVDQDSLVWRSGMDDWEPAGDIPEVGKLFSAVPMPRIGPVDTSFDLGARIDDLKPSPLGESSDPFSQVPDGASDPNWQPHGLTDVYQAANLAEAAGLAAPGGGLPGNGKAKPVEDEGEWKPGAASALASLVQDEIARIDAGPEERVGGGLAPADESLLEGGMFADGAGAGAEVGGLSGPPSGVGLAAGLGAVPGLGGPTLSSSGMHAVGPGLSAAGLSSPAMSMPALPQVPTVDSYPPQAAMSGFSPIQQPAMAQSRNPLLYVGVFAGVLIAIVMTAALVKLAFFGGPVATPVAAVTPPPVAATATPPGTEPPADTAPAGAGAVGAAQDPSAAPAEGTGTPEGSSPGDATTTGGGGAAAGGGTPPDDPADGPDGRVAMADTKASGGGTREPDPPPKSDTKAKTTKRTATKPSKRDDAREREREREKEKEREKREKEERASKRKKRDDAERSTRRSKKGCDPILDIDCEEKPKKEAKTAALDKLSKADILVVVKKNVKNINACFEKHGVKDTVKMEWKILKSGRTSGVRVLDDKYAGTPAGRCLTNEIKRWNFPAYSGPPPPPIKFPFKP